MSKSKVQRVAVEIGTDNVYVDLGYADAEEMVVKAQLVTSIAEIIKRKGLTETEAGQLLGVSELRLSNLLRGRFRSFAKRRLMDYLVRLG